MKKASLHPAAFSLISVVAGLCVRESLLRVVPGIVSGGSIGHPSPQNWQLTLETARTVVFLTVLVRFYLGAVFYFNEVYMGPDADEDYPRKNYGLDYVIGMVHFILFFGWALTIDDMERNHAAGASHYLGLGSIVLLYDLLWLAISLRYSTARKLTLWTIVNLATVILCAAIFFALKEMFSLDSVFREQAVLSLIFSISLIDIAEIINEKHYIVDCLTWAISAKNTKASAAAG